jgi:hypothetical protein
VVNRENKWGFKNVEIGSYMLSSEREDRSVLGIAELKGMSEYCTATRLTIKNGQFGRGE